jgi:hypothetical protein
LIPVNHWLINRILSAIETFRQYWRFFIFYWFFLKLQHFINHLFTFHFAKNSQWKSLLMLTYCFACFHELLSELQLVFAFKCRRFFVSNHQIPSVSSLQLFGKIFYLRICHSDDIIFLHPKKPTFCLSHSEFDKVAEKP